MNAGKDGIKDRIADRTTDRKTVMQQTAGGDFARAPAASSKSRRAPSAR